MIRTGEVAADQPPFDVTATFAAVQGGDRAALGELYAHCAPDVHTQLMRLSGGNEPLAEDLTQDTFVKAFTSASAAEASNVKGWLNRIARNNYLDYYRRTKRIAIEPLGDALTDVQSPLPPTPLEDVVITSVDLNNYVRQVDETLPEDFSNAVRAVAMLDLSYDQAATVLGIKRATLATRLHRGRQQAQSIPVPAGYELQAIAPKS